MWRARAAALQCGGNDDNAQKRWSGDDDAVAAPSDAQSTCEASTATPAHIARTLILQLCDPYINLEDSRCTTDPKFANGPQCDPLYIFDDKFVRRKLEGEFGLPARLSQVYSPNIEPVYQFGLGPPCSGAPSHFHEDAWNYLVAGAKLWWLKLPARSVYSRVPPAREMLSASEEEVSNDVFDDDIVCLQRPGDFMYVPRGWSHRTLNLELGVGIAAEYTMPMPGDD